MRWADGDHAEREIRAALSRCLSVGTTGICAYSSPHYQATDRALKIATKIGFRGVIGQTMMDRRAPDALLSPAKQLVDETTSLLERYPPANEMAAAVTPRFAVTCTEELLSCAGELAANYDATVQTHLAETEAECDLVSDLFGGAQYLDVYGRNGLVTEKSIFGHGIYLDDSSRNILAKNRSVIAHCPTANSFLRSGAMNRHSMHVSNVNVVLGSDIGAGYEHSMVRVARAAAETAAVVEKQNVSNDTSQVVNERSAARAWYDITMGAAKRLNWNDTGSP